MKLIKYLFYKWKLPIYAALSAVISLLLMLVTAGGIGVFLRMLPVVLCLLLTLRASDDIFDYEHDSGRKTQHLSKKQLVIFGCDMAALYVLLNILFFGVFGVLSIAAVAYILLMEKLPPLKTAYMALLFLYYICAVCGGVLWHHLAVILGCVAVSVLYYIIKGKVRK